MRCDLDTLKPAINSLPGQSFPTTACSVRTLTPPSYNKQAKFRDPKPLSYQSRRCRRDPSWPANRLTEPGTPGLLKGSLRFLRVSGLGFRFFFCGFGVYVPAEGRRLLGPKRPKPCKLPERCHLPPPATWMHLGDRLGAPRSSFCSFEFWQP